MTFRRGALVCAIALLPLLALSSASLWIDEANSALKAMQPSLESWWRVLASEKGSDLQMPLYMFYLWSWEKIAGHSELALRLANVPWLVLAHYSLYRLCRTRAINPIPLLLVASVNPFLWFYLNEARPYVMQYAGSCLVICALSEMFDRRLSDASTSWLFAVGILLLSGASMLGMAWAASAILASAFIRFRRGDWSISKKDLVSIFGVGASLGLLGGYYVWTLMSGARGSAAGKMTLQNLAFIGYELLGFSGLGPGRAELRDAGITTLREFLLPLVLLSTALFLGLADSLRALSNAVHRDKLCVGAIYGLLAATVLIVAGFAADFRLLGRHFTPLSPLICILLTVGLTSLWRTRWKLIFAAMMVLWLASSLSIRFAPRHQKDDYRRAATEARAAVAQQKRVWWVADRAAAKYYNVPIEVPNAAVDLVINPSTADLQRLPPADVVVLSKPDLYDANGALAAFLRDQKYEQAGTLQAFTVWQR